MLTQAGALRLGRFAVYRDRGPGSAAGYTHRFFVLPDVPKLALDAAGQPEFLFLWYRGPAGTERAGGMVMLTVELAADETERAELTAGLVKALPDEDLSDLEISPVPFLDGTVELSLAGETVASAPARLQGSQRATFAVELDAEDAALVHSLISTGADLFSVRYDLTFAYRLDGVDLRVWCDGRRAHTLAADLTGVENVREALVTERAAGVELISEQPLTPEYRATLQSLGQQLLTAALGTSLKRPYGPEAETTLNHTFTQATLLPQHAVSSSVIRLDLPPDQLAQRIRVVDLTNGFFAALEVMVVCTVDFSRELIDVVHVTISYDHSGPGGRVQRSGELTFRAGTGPQRFRTDLAAPDRRAVSWRTAVHYRGDPMPVMLEHPATETELIVLDLDGAGVLEVSAAVRDPSWTNVSAATVELEHPSTGHAARLVLDAGRPTDTWTAVVRTTPGPIRYRVTWHSPSGVDTPGDWVETTNYAVLVDPPRELTAAQTVELVSVGEFADLAQLLVELRTGPDTPATPFSFTEPGQSLTWSTPGPDGGPLRYQSRSTLIYADGRRDELSWVDRDTPLCLVGDLLRFTVLLEPRLLDLGGAFRLALLELAPLPDGTLPATPVATDTLVFRDATMPQHWSFRMTAPGQSDYCFRLTVVPSTGPRAGGAWRTARNAILVLRPPEN